MTMDPTQRLPMLQLTRCPECGATAEIQRRAVLDSTDGPIEHAYIRCVATHWFVMPISMLQDAPLRQPSTPARSRSVS